MTDADTSPKYDPTAVGKKILAEVVDQLPALWTAEFLIAERIVSDPKDKREVEAAEWALDNLQRSGKIRLGTNELVEPTSAALGPNAP
jgi:hypothetical protein